MRPLLFMVADKNMENALRGFFERNHWYKAIECAPIDFNPSRDILVAAGQNDPGIYVRANELLGNYSRKYDHVVVMVDAAWEGSPGAEAIRSKVRGHILNAGWQPGAGLELVLQPEVDVWLWSPSPHAAAAMGWPSWSELKEALEQEKFPMDALGKPVNPKAAAEWALRKRKKPRSSTIYKQVTSRVSLGRCRDPAMLALVAAMKRWFPI